MSTYNKQTVHPETKAIENATWLDDAFGSHSYGVIFPSDGKMFKADEFDWRENPATMAKEGKPVQNPDIFPLTIKQTTKVSVDPYPHKEGEPQIIKEQSGDGHESVTTKHPDGSQDVQINVKRLDIKNRTPEDTVAEDAILSNLKKVQVGVLVLCKANGQSAYFVSPLTEVRGRAQQVVNSYLSSQPRENIMQIEQYCRHFNLPIEKSFAIIEVAVGERPPKVSTL